MQSTIQSPDSARAFLLEKLLEQAKHDGVSISDIERRMLLFSETCQNPPDFDASEKFDAEYSDSAYEAKIAKLLRRSYARDKDIPERKAEWKDNLLALTDEDFYGLVMVDQAGIPRPSAALRSEMLKLARRAVIVLSVAALGVLVVFQPWRLHLVLPDWLRLALFAGFIWFIWQLGKIYSR